MADEKNFQEKTLTVEGTSVDFVLGGPSQVEISGDFSSGTVTWVNTGGTVSLTAGVTVDTAFPETAQRLTYGINGSTTPDITIRIWPNKVPF